MKTAAMYLPLLLVSLWATTVNCQTQDNSRAQVAEAATHFTLDVFKSVLRTTQGNVVLSPLSVQTLLAMLQQGAKNTSSQQLEQVLHLNQQTSKTGFTTVIQNFQKNKYKSKLIFASKIFVNADFDLLPQFQSDLHTNFNSGAEKLPKSSTDAAARINDWVKYVTKNRITELVKPSAITSRTQMVMANAIYFKGTWLKTFDATKTASEKFHTTHKAHVSAPMMSQRGLFSAGESATLKARWLEMQFDGGEFTMVLIVPTQPQGLNDVLTRLNFDEFKNILNSDIIKDVNIKMPRFHLDAETPLVDALRQLGLVDVFDQRSNLEGISLSKTPLIVSDILHRAEIEVNEEGSEASAASALVVNTLSLTPEYEKMDFFADQPFLAVIVDKVNNMPIFVARVSNPLTT